MRKWYRTARVVLALVAPLLAAACAGIRFIPADVRKPGEPPDATTEFEIEADPSGNGCRKKSPPDAIYAQAEETVTWKIKNVCGKPVEVTLFEFHEKHRQLGKFDPFSNRPQVVEITAGGEGNVTAVIRKTVEDDELGFHVFRYRIRIRAGSVVNNQDPEIIIEWPRR